MSAGDVGRDEIDQLTETGHFDALQRGIALEIAGVMPNVSQWHRFLGRLFLFFDGCRDKARNETLASKLILTGQLRGSSLSSSSTSLSQPCNVEINSQSSVAISVASSERLSRSVATDKPAPLIYCMRHAVQTQ